MATQEPRGDPSFKQRSDFLKRWWADPQTYPDEFKAWMRSALVQDPNIIWERSQIPVLPYSKLDIAAGSIEGGKLGWHAGTAPPPNPQNGDLWLWTPTGGSPWLMWYDAAWTTDAYKWKFLGGPPWSVFDGTDVGTSGGTWFTNPQLTIPRIGYYECQYSASFGQTPNANTNVQWDFDLGDGTTNYGDPFRTYTRFRTAATAAAWGYAVACAPAWREFTTLPTLKLLALPSGWDLNCFTRTIAIQPIRVS